MLLCGELHRNAEIVSYYYYCNFYRYSSYGKIVLNSESYIIVGLCFKEGNLCVSVL